MVHAYPAPSHIPSDLARPVGFGPQSAHTQGPGPAPLCAPSNLAGPADSGPWSVHTQCHLRALSRSLHLQAHAACSQYPHVGVCLQTPLKRLLWRQTLEHAWGKVLEREESDMTAFMPTSESGFSLYPISLSHLPQLPQKKAKGATPTHLLLASPLSYCLPKKLQEAERPQIVMP